MLMDWDALNRAVGGRVAGVVIVRRWGRAVRRIWPGLMVPPVSGMMAILLSGLSRTSREMDGVGVGGGKWRRGLSEGWFGSPSRPALYS